MIKSNIKWGIIEKIVKIILAFLIGALVARSLGPEGLGKISLGTAILSILNVIAGMGMQNIVVKLIVEEENKNNKIIGTAIIITTIASFFIFAILGWILFIYSNMDAELKVIVIVINSAILFRQADVLQYIYEAKINFKGISKLLLATNLLMTILKIAFLKFELTVIWYAALIPLEVAIIAIGTYAIAGRDGLITYKLNIKLSTVRKLLIKSFPLLIASLSSILYLKIDQIMIGTYLNNEELGLYSAATRLSELMYIIPMTIMASYYPVLVEFKQKNESQYSKLTSNLLNVGSITAILASMATLVFSETLINIAYGNKYYEAAAILKIHGWTLLFVTIGVISHAWYVIEGLQSNIMYRTTFGALLNIILNSQLIPEYGGIGAAIGTLITQAVTTIGVDIITTKTRKLLILKIESLNPMIYFESVRKILK